jgi:thiamine-phosphate pyrophosphorylase
MRFSTDLSLYLVTKRGKLTLEIFFEVICKSIEGGVRVVQLREKEAPDEEVIAIGRRLRSFLKPLGIPLIINDRINVAKAVGADGVHLGQSDRKVAEARGILGREAIIGLSVETMEQAIAANGEEVDYLAASPLFLTNTKSDCGQPWGLDGLKELCSLRIPVVAIGGINETNIVDVCAQGVAGVAVVSAIFDAPCPKAAALFLENKIRMRS